ncbi:MAG: DNA polymerase III subunit delta [Ruminococcus sp.]
MPKTDAKKIFSQLKNNEIYNIYYIYGQNTVGAEGLANAVIKKVTGDYSDFALTKFDGKSLNVRELSDQAEMFPMLSDYNCILIDDFNADEQKESVCKPLLEFLKSVPPQTVIIFRITSADIKKGKKTVSPKNKKITDIAEKYGILCECAVPSMTELSKYIISSAKKNGCSISPKCAVELAEYCLGDTLSISNEIQKLCSYIGNGEITSDTIKLLVYRQSDTDIYKLANAVCRSDRKSAFEALDELLAQKTERVKILFAVSSSFIDMYRAKIAIQQGKQISQTAQDFSYQWEFVLKNAFRDCSKISLSKLRKCLSILRDTALTLNSSSGNERVIMEETIAKMLTL